VKERWGGEYTGNENAYAVVYFLYFLWLDNVLWQLGCGYTNTNMPVCIKHRLQLGSGAVMEGRSAQPLWSILFIVLLDICCFYSCP